MYKLISWKVFWFFFVSFSSWIAVGWYLVSDRAIDFFVDLAYRGLPYSTVQNMLPYLRHGLLVYILVVFPLAMLICDRLRACEKGERMDLVVTTSLMAIFGAIITGSQFLAMPDFAGYPEFTALMMICILPTILMVVSPSVKAISRRLIFLALGLLLLIALNELSKLGLDLTAPKLQG